MIAEAVDMLLDPAHWLFEVVSGGILLALGAAWHAVWQRHHDAGVHGTCVTVCQADSGIHGCELVTLHPGPHRCPTCGNVWSTDDAGRYRRHPRTHRD